jgi:hypothetical protein
MKTIIIINEPFSKMILGKNSTLAYILSVFELGHETYLYNLPKTGEIFPQIDVIKLSQEEGLVLVKKYKEINQEILQYAQSGDYGQMIKMPLIRVCEFVQNIKLEKLLLKDVQLVLQRSEPMKAPFPPEGLENVDEVLAKMRKSFSSDLIFNCPIGLSDKEIPQEINRILKKEHQEPIAIATAEFKLSDQSFSTPFSEMIKECKKLFKDSAGKLVVKPKNSAQTLGVFAIKIYEEGFDLNSLKDQNISKLADTQSYNIKPNFSEDESKEMVEILCFVQRVKNNQNIFDKFGQNKIAEISRSEIFGNACELYNAEVLVQPFLEGVKFGDIRLNYLKNSDGDFYLAGSTFRSSLRKSGDSNFTTGYINGGSISKPLSVLELEEKKDLLKKSEIILRILNKDLREKYRNSIELGADFILVGDGKTALLGEINHHCQGLIPVSEAMEKASNSEAIYDGGLALTKRAIVDLMILQKK